MLTTKERLLEIIKQEVKTYAAAAKQIDQDEVEKTAAARKAAEDNLSAGGELADAGADALELGIVPVQVAVAAKKAPRIARALGILGRGLMAPALGPVGIAMFVAEVAFFMGLDELIANYGRDPNAKSMIARDATIKGMKIARQLAKGHRKVVQNNYKGISPQQNLTNIKALNTLITGLKKMGATEQPLGTIRNIRNDLRKNQNKFTKKAPVRTKKVAKAKPVKKTQARPAVAKTAKTSKSDLKKQLRTAWSEMKKAARKKGLPSWRKLSTRHPTRIKVRNIYKQLKA